MVRILIREGQDPNEKTQNMHNTPMHIAARSGHYLVVKFLIDLGCPCTTQNAQGMTARLLLATGWLGDDLDKVEALAMNEKGRAKQQAIRDQQKLLGDTYRLLAYHESQALQRA